MAAFSHSRKSRPFYSTFLLYLAIFFSLSGTVAVAANELYLTTGGQSIAPLETFRDCDACPEMIMLPLGSFMMGAPLEESAFLYSLWAKPKPGVEPGYPHEGPVHEVEIDIPIAMGRNEITREEWVACVSEGGCSHTPDPRILKFGGGYYYADDPRHPVMDVSYLDMLQYVDWLNGKVGADVYRLPTEAEWEYAARAGTQTRFAQGDTLSPEQANIGVFHRQGNRSVADPNNRKMPVTVDELDAANPWGFRHIAGNILERTMSCWTDVHLALATSSSYLADAQKHAACRRVAKGGSLGSGADYARPANRGHGRENRRSPRTGFRILREM
ncbi:formylglycine-generating enzyme family protein [Sulfitobacter sp.]|uniref:formylglycine-generating enzyme family protein n=1 Tax=Sulfitobacter sp. TaxID=1903071 RepID=UPI003299C1FF